MDRVVTAPDPARAPCLHRAPAAVRRVRAQRFLSLFDCPAQAPPHPGHGCCRGPTLLPAGAHPQPASLTGIKPQDAAVHKPGCSGLDRLFYHVQVAAPEPRLVDVDYLEVECKSALNP